MDFLKISIWLVTTILSVNSYSRSHTGCVSCPYYHLNYAMVIHDQRNCFCFNNQRDYKKVPEVIHADGLFSERLVYYVYKDVRSGRETLYIPNREKQTLIPDLAYEREDILIDNPSDVFHSFNDLKVLIEINQNKRNTNEPSVIDDTVTTLTIDEPTSTTEAPSTTTDGLTVTNEKPTATTEEPTVTTKRSTFLTEEPTISTEKQTVTTKVPTTVTSKTTVSVDVKTVTNIIGTTNNDEPTGTTEGATTIIFESSVTTEKPTSTTATNKPTVTFEGITTDELSGTTEGATKITDIPSVINKKPTTTTENPTGTTNESKVTIEDITVTNVIRTTDEPSITKGPTTITDEPAIIIDKSIVITKKPTGTTLSTFITEDPTTITDEPSVTTEKSTVSSVVTEEPTTAHTPKITSITEAATVTTKVSSTEELITTESSKPVVTTEKTTTEAPSTTKSPEPTIITVEPTTSEKPGSVTILPLPDDGNRTGKVFSLQDLYKIVEFIQKKKDKPIVDIWEQLLKGLNLDKSQVNENRDGGKIEFEIRDDSDLEHNSYTFDLWFQQQLDGFSESDHFISLAEIKQYVRNILLENGMIVTMEGLLTDLQGKLLDLSELELRPILIGKPLNIGKIFEEKDHKSDFLIPSDSPYMQAIVVTLSNPSRILGIIPLGKTTIQNKNEKFVTVMPPEKNEGMVKDWVQNGNKYSKDGIKWKENKWFNIKGRPKLANGLKDSHSLQKKIIKHKHFKEPKNSQTVLTFKSPKDRYKVKSSRLVEILGENDLRKLDALKSQLFNDKKKLATEKNLLTAWKNDGFVQIGEEQPLSLNVDSNELEAWENLLKGTKWSEKDMPTAWKNNVYTQTDNELISGLNVDDSTKRDIWNNQLIMDKKLIPENMLLPSWRHLGQLQAGNIKLDPIELDAYNHKFVNGPLSTHANEMFPPWINREKLHTSSGQVISFKADKPSELNALNQKFVNGPISSQANKKLPSWLNREKLRAGRGQVISFKADEPSKLNVLNQNLVNGPISSEASKLPSWVNRDKLRTGSEQVISFKADDPSELDALKNQLLNNPNVYGKAGIKLLAALQRNEVVKAGTGETISYKVNNLKNLDQLSTLLKDPTIFAKTAKKLLSALQRKGIVKAGNGEAYKFKVHNPRELEALRNQLLKHPKIFSRAAKELLTVMKHNGIGLSDIAPVINESAPTSLEDSIPSAEKYLYTQKYLAPQEVPWPSDDAVGYYDEVEDDITGRIVGGSAATGSGAPLSMKGRMKDF